LSSFLSKLMTLVRSSVRGTRPPGSVTGKPAGGSREPSSRAEVDEASSRIDQTQDTDDSADIQASRSPESQPRPQTLRADEAEALEEDRIVDLLRGKQS
jgi:hypothetical protein